MDMPAQRDVAAPYEFLPEDDIVEAARDGSEYAYEYIFDKYRGFVRAKARSYFLIGADREDIIQEGMIVRHSKFGLGEVVKIEGTEPNKKAKVLFEVVGEKQLLLKFAKLKIIE